MCGEDREREEAVLAMLDVLLGMLLDGQYSFKFASRLKACCTKRLRFEAMHNQCPK